MVPWLAWMADSTDPYGIPTNQKIVDYWQQLEPLSYEGEEAELLLDTQAFLVKHAVKSVP